jgi:hypothetical protein
VSATLRDILDLLERARYDLERGWVEAAIDCIGRAERILRDAREESCDG